MSTHKKFLELRVREFGMLRELDGVLLFPSFLHYPTGGTCDVLTFAYQKSRFKGSAFELECIYYLPLESLMATWSANKGRLGLA